MCDNGQSASLPSGFSLGHVLKYAPSSSPSAASQLTRSDTPVVISGGCFFRSCSYAWRLRSLPVLTHRSSFRAVVFSGRAPMLGGSKPRSLPVLTHRSSFRAVVFSGRVPMFGGSKPRRLPAILFCGQSGFRPPCRPEAARSLLRKAAGTDLFPCPSRSCRSASSALRPWKVHRP